MGHCQISLQLMWELKWVLYFGIVSVPVPFPHKFCLNETLAVVPGDPILLPRPQGDRLDFETFRDITRNLKQGYQWPDESYTGRARLIRSHSSTRFCFELSGNSN